MDLVEHLSRQREWSKKTFGPGRRTEGVLDHIGKEVEEIRRNPADLFEWVDVMILAFDGAWRQGYEPAQIAAAITSKQYRNENRQWPDWRSVPETSATEHIRTPGER